MTGMLKIRKIITGPFMTNTIILSSKGSCVVVDPGGEQKKIIDDIEMNGLKPKAIIATHGHFDHVLGASQLQEKYNVPLIIHVKDEDMMRNSGTMMNSFGISGNFTLPSRIETFSGKMDIAIGDHEISLNETPGHTYGSICIMGDGFILTGDTLFRLSVGRVDVGGNEEELVKSLKFLLSFPESTKIYPGHGEMSDLRFEILNNVFAKNIMSKNSLY